MLSHKLCEYNDLFRNPRTCAYYRAIPIGDGDVLITVIHSVNLLSIGNKFQTGAKYLRSLTPILEDNPCFSTGS